MVEVLLYIATSLDGYIASTDGSVDWLDAVAVEGEDYGYQVFFESVDALIMGSHTYEQILGFGDWPYGDKPCWVMSQRPLTPSLPTVHISGKSVNDLLDELESTGVARAWLVGGSEVIASFEKSGRIDEYILSLIPQLLGEGLSLFQAGRPGRSLRLTASCNYPSGLVQLNYRPVITTNC